MPASIERAVTTRTIAARAEVGITDPSFDRLFACGNAREGVAALIAAGDVTVNGFPVPSERLSGEYTTERFEVNGGRALWREPDATWSWDAQVLFKGSSKPYAEAVIGFVDDVTRLRGSSYRLTFDATVVTRIDATVVDVAFANTLTRSGIHTRFTPTGSGDGSTDKPDPSTLTFTAPNVGGEPQAQDVVLYWLDENGWHLEPAARRQVVVDIAVSPEGRTSGSIDGVPITDSRLTLQYLEPWNRPSQPIRAMAWLGETHVEAIQWLVADGITVGFSRGSGARAALDAALDTAADALETIAVSVVGDGSDVTAGEPWVTSDYRDVFARAVADARSERERPDATDNEYEGALFRLAQAYGGRTGDRFSIIGNTYFGKTGGMNGPGGSDTGYNGTGYWTSAQENAARSSMQGLHRTGSKEVCSPNSGTAE